MTTHWQFSEVVSIVQSVNTEFYTKKDGVKVIAIRLRGKQALFVDWKARVSFQPRIGDIVKIVYSDWAPRRFGYHHVIESYQSMTEAELETMKGNVKTFARALFPYKQGLDAWLTTESQAGSL